MCGWEVIARKNFRIRYCAPMLLFSASSQPHLRCGLRQCWVTAQQTTLLHLQPPSSHEPSLQLIKTSADSSQSYAHLAEEREGFWERIEKNNFLCGHYLFPFILSLLGWYSNLPLAWIQGRLRCIYCLTALLTSSCTSSTETQARIYFNTGDNTHRFP